MLLFITTTKLFDVTPCNELVCVYVRHAHIIFDHINFGRIIFGRIIFGRIIFGHNIFGHIIFGRRFQKLMPKLLTKAVQKVGAN